MDGFRIGEYFSCLPQDSKPRPLGFKSAAEPIIFERILGLAIFQRFVFDVYMLDLMF
jgi:hypothetical protein